MLLARANSAYRPLRPESTRDHAMSALTAGMAGLMLMTTSGLAAPAAPTDPSGYWLTKDDESIIRIGPCTAPAGAAATPTTPLIYCGTIVWLKEPLEKGVPKIDNLNSDLTKRGRPIIGMEVFSEFSADGDHWKGKAYNSDDGKTWDVTFKVQPDKANGDKAEITGCLVWPLCQSETFTKVQTVPGGDPTLAGNTPPHGTPAKAVPPPPPHR